MIKYDPLWRTLKEKGISQYQLIKDYGIDKAQLQRLRQNLVVKTLILNRLCQILDCRIEDIMEYVPDDGLKVLFRLDEQRLFYYPLIIMYFWTSCPEVIPDYLYYLRQVP